MALLLEIYTFSQILPHHNVCIVLLPHPHPYFPFLRKDGVLAKIQLRRGLAPACFLYPVSTDCSVLGLLGSREATTRPFLNSLGWEGVGRGEKRERVGLWGYVLSSSLLPSREQVRSKHQVTMGHPPPPTLPSPPQKGSMACVSN